MFCEEKIDVFKVYLDTKVGQPVLDIHGANRAHVIAIKDAESVSCVKVLPCNSLIFCLFSELFIHDLLTDHSHDSLLRLLLANGERTVEPP